METALLWRSSSCASVGCGPCSTWTSDRGTRHRSFSPVGASECGMRRCASARRTLARSHPCRTRRVRSDHHPASVSDHRSLPIMPDDAPAVLVVEDEPLLRLLVAELLLDSGFRVIEAANAAE